MAGESASLWLLIQGDVKTLVEGKFDRKRVLAANAGTFRLQSYDGEGTENDATYLCWPTVPGDDVVTLKYGNRDVVLGSLSVPGTARDQIPPFVDPGEDPDELPDDGTYLPDGSREI